MFSSFVLYSVLVVLVFFRLLLLCVALCILDGWIVCEAFSLEKAEEEKVVSEMSQRLSEIALVELGRLRCSRLQAEDEFSEEEEGQ